MTAAEEKRSFQKLLVWQKAFDLTVSVYKLSSGFPRNEEFGLKSQIRRSAVSIPSNIAEGYMRQYTKEYVQFLHISLASAAELLTELLLAKELFSLDYGADEAIREVNEIISILVKMVKTLKEKIEQPLYPLPSTLPAASASPGDADA